MDISSIAQRKAEQYGVPYDLLMRIIQQESGGNPNAVSPVGARGVMQLMPETAAELGVADVNDTEQNIDGGTRYFAQQLKRFGSVPLALAAYNAGAGNVEKYGGIPPFEETQNYVRSITGNTGNTGGGNVNGYDFSTPSAIVQLEEKLKQLQARNENNLRNSSVSTEDLLRMRMMLDNQRNAEKEAASIQALSNPIFEALRAGTKLPQADTSALARYISADASQANDLQKRKFGLDMYEKAMNPQNADNPYLKQNLMAVAKQYGAPDIPTAGVDPVTSIIPILEKLGTLQTNNQARNNSAITAMAKATKGGSETNGIGQPVLKPAEELAFNKAMLEWQDEVQAIMDDQRFDRSQTEQLILDRSRPFLLYAENLGRGDMVRKILRGTQDRLQGISVYKDDKGNLVQEKVPKAKGEVGDPNAPVIYDRNRIMNANKNKTYDINSF